MKDIQLENNSDKPIEYEKLEKILKAEHAAPTGNNFQPKCVFLIKSEEW